MAIIQIWTTCTCNGKPSWVEKSYLFPCVQINAMCGKLEWIFKHIGVMAWTQTFRTMAFKIQEILKWSEIHETLLDVMKWYHDAVVKKLACFLNVLAHTSHKIGASHEKTHGSEREEYACLMTNRQSLPLKAWHFLYR